MLTIKIYAYVICSCSIKGYEQRLTSAIYFVNLTLGPCNWHIMINVNILKMLCQSRYKLLGNIHKFFARAFIQANCLLASCINTSTALGAKGIFIVAGALFGARIFFALRIEATIALFTSVLTFVRWNMPLAFFGASGILALSVKATAALGAKALTFVRFFWIKQFTGCEG